MSLLGNPVPTLPGVVAKGLNVKMHPVGRAVVGGGLDAKVHGGGGGSAAEGGAKGGGRGSKGAAGGKINTGPLVNKSEVNGGANSSKFPRLHLRRWYVP